MNPMAWIIFLAPAAVLAMFAWAVWIKPGSNEERIRRRKAVIDGMRQTMKENKVMVVGSVLGMLGLNGFFGMFPMGAGQGGQSGAEQGRILMGLCLYLLCLTAWATSMWKARIEIEKRLNAKGS